MRQMFFRFGAEIPVGVMMFVFQFGKLVESPHVGQMSESSGGFTALTKSDKETRKIIDKVGLEVYSVLKAYLHSTDRVKEFFGGMSSLNEKFANDPKGWNKGLDDLIEKMIPKTKPHWSSKAKFYAALIVLGIPVLSYTSIVGAQNKAVENAGGIIGGIVGGVPFEGKKKYMKDMFAKCVENSKNNREPRKDIVEENVEKWVKGGVKFVYDIFSSEEKENEFMRGSKRSSFGK